MAELDIIIVTFNTREAVIACLDSIATFPPSCAYRVHVVDNASSDGSVAAIRTVHPAATVHALDRNLGFAAANNHAIRAAGGALILLLNSDARVTAGALDSLIDRLAITGAAIAGPRLVNSDGRPEVSFGPMLSPVAEFRQMVRTRLANSNGGLARRYVRRLLANEREVDWVSGACLLVRRDAAVAAGLLDERYFMYEEDVDFCAAIRAQGGKVLFTPRAEVVHLHGRSGSTERRRSQYDQSHVAFYRKHAPAWVPLLRVWQRVRR